MKYSILFALILSVCACSPDGSRVAELEQRVAELETELSNYRYSVSKTRFVESKCIGDPVVQNIHASVDIMVDQELLDWYYSQPVLDPDAYDFEFSDDQIKPYEEKFLADPDEYLKLLTVIGSNDLYLEMGLWRGITHLSHSLLIPYLALSPPIVQVAYSHGLHRNYPNEFEQAFLQWSESGLENVPEGLMLAAIETQNPEYFEMARQYAVTGQSRLETFKVLNIFKQPDLDLLAETVWREFSYNNDDKRNFETTVIAARYAGEKEALYELAYQWNESSDFYRLEYEYIIAEFVKIPDFSEFYEEVRTLVYDTKRKQWKMP